MEQLDYSTVPPSRGRGARRVLAATALTFAVIILICCGGITIPSQIFFWRMRNANVVGKTQAQITAQLGQPDPWYSMTQPDGTVIIVYRGPMGDGYRIDIRNGIAVGTLDLHK